MSFRPAERIREPAEPMKPVVDPAGWTAAQLAADDDWIYELSTEETDDILTAVDAVRRRGLDIIDVRRSDVKMPVVDRTLALLYDELLEGRGFFLLRGLPVERMDRADAAIAFWLIGTRLGRALSQNAQGHMLGHVKDLGADYSRPDVRGYLTNAEMNFHCDQCDYVGLLCLHPAKSGGASRIASSVTAYNEMLKTRPDLAQELVREFYLTRHGEIPPGSKPWYKLPTFSFRDGYFSGRGASGHVAKAQKLPGVPPLTDAQKEAIAMLKEINRSTYFDMDFRAGDIQFLHNHVIVHTRTAFEDWPEPERKRHLMRLWLTDPAGRPLVDGYRENIQGVEVAGMVRHAPLDVSEAA